jgi:hypothetical protein
VPGVGCLRLLSTLAATVALEEQALPPAIRPFSARRSRDPQSIASSRANRKRAAGLLKKKRRTCAAAWDPGVLPSYLVESNPAPQGARLIRSYDLQPDGSVRNMRVLYDFYPGRNADGVSIDSQGNLYASAGLELPRRWTGT